VAAGFFKHLLIQAFLGAGILLPIQQEAAQFAGPVTPAFWFGPTPVMEVEVKVLLV
jgi:hypothetical protein